MRSPRPAISHSRSAVMLAAAMFAAMIGSGILSVPADASGQAAPVVKGPDDVVPADPIVVDGHAFASGYVLVQVRPGTRADRLPARALADAGVANVKSIFVEPLKDAATAARIGLDRWYRCTLQPGADAQAARARLARIRGVERAELDPEGGLAEIPNDTNFGIQYALRNTGQSVNGMAGTAGADIGMTAAWDFTQGDPDLVIAVLDSGVDPHPELAGRILPGLNVPDGNTATSDECNHGTHVAGIIAASANNAMGIAGIARTARILPVVVVNGCSGFEVNVAAGLTWAADRGARLINMSLQFNLGSTPLLQAVQYAHAQGALIVAASGNSNLNPPAFPARWDETLAVGSTDNRDIRAISSNYGPELDLVAPGVNVWSLNAASSGYGYTFKSGTSMATPHVTGVAALLWSYRPDLTRDEVRQYLLSSAHDLGTAGYDIYYGAGRLDAEAAFAAVPPYAAEDINQDGAVNAADLSLLLASWGACGDCDACAADIDGDCSVGASDLSLLLVVW